jgi:hypothetical protein
MLIEIDVDVGGASMRAVREKDTIIQPEKVKTPGNTPSFIDVSAIDRSG